MKIEYLENINSSGDSIVRLYDFDPVQADIFRKTVHRCIINDKRQFDTSEIDIEEINCNLTFRISDKDIGITTTDKKAFRCDLTLVTYDKMTQLLLPFCSDRIDGYQWLYDINTPIELLFSPDGNW